jgi:hypothetical protein
MNEQSFVNPVPKLLASAVCLLSLLAFLAVYIFSQPVPTLVEQDTKSCLASEGQVSLRDCLTAVYQARLVDAYTLGQLR